MAEKTRPDYASVSDLTALFRPLTESETERAEALLPIVSDRLRMEAINVGEDLDRMIAENPVLASVARSITVDIVARAILTPTSGAMSVPMTQISESAGGYSASGTFLNPGGGIFIKRAELAALGLRRQKVGVIEIYADPRDNSQTL